MRKFRIATRGSDLASAQTNLVISMMQQRNADLEFEVITLKTTGDRVTDRPLFSFRGTGVFVKEIQNALLSGEADLAVHSLKDMPVQEHEKLIIAATPLRTNPHDLFITKDNSNLETIHSGAVVGTSSPRRMLQLKAFRKDLNFLDLRGNVNTRLKKLYEGKYDAIVLAAAGIERLGKKLNNTSLIPASVCLPAAGQGILAVECREDDSEAKQVAELINHKHTMVEALCERTFLHTVGGGCAMPVAALAKTENSKIRIDGMIGDPNTGKVLRMSYDSSCSQSDEAGKQLAQMMVKACESRGIKLK
ncbi:hydroxymethylbilane synthase [Chitinispirillales bacterium ANBcel5]|uniref:hydroxymethylbilane synthase n=1 Tax=Cellulosispirillum alkaliphilum TaxID=3039283 RepID=UPI002A543161|nr:hydroxymethylbilane synthase [Chitinispirillales bacterium ANBcel5]